MDTVRLQFVVAADQDEELRRLMESGGLRTKKDLFNNALAVLGWAARMVRQGFSIHATNDQTGQHRELCMPFLEHVAYDSSGGGGLEEPIAVSHWPRVAGQAHQGPPVDDGRRLLEQALLERDFRLQVLGGIAKGLRDSDQVAAVMKRTLEQLAHHFAGLRAMYLNVDGDGQLALSRVVSFDEQPFGEGLNIDLREEGSYWRSLLAGQPLVLADITGDREKNYPPAYTESGAGAALEMPVLVDGELVGVLRLDSPAPRAWSLHEVQSVRDVASYLSILFQHARTREDRQRLEARLQHSQKLEAIGQLAGGIAHDFNNLLTGIAGYCQLVISELDDKPARDDAEHILKFVDRGASLVRQLLAFSRRQPMVLEIVDVNDLVSSMSTMIERLIGDEIEMVFHPDGNLGPVQADAGQLEQVLMNICVNARDSMPGGGKVVIETRNFVIDDRIGRAEPGIPPGQYVLIAVTDNGCGIDEAVQPRMFDPFFTTKERGKGTGLGLSTVHGIIQQHNGHIRVYSEIGVGTTMRIYVPRHDGPVLLMPDDYKRSKDLRGNETIVLVDDEPEVRELLERALSNFGYNVISAGHPGEAEALFDEHGDHVDLLVTDVVMPDRDGTELYARLSAKRDDLKVLFMSGYTERSISEHGILDQGLPFLEKPFSPEQMATRVRLLLDAPED